MVYSDKQTGKKTQLIEGDKVEVKGYGEATIINVNTEKVKILGGDAIVSYEGGQYGVIKESDVINVVSLVFSIIRFFKNLFGHGQ